MVVLLEDSPISTEELWRSVRVTIGLLDISTSPIAQYGRVFSSRKSLGGSKRRWLKNNGGPGVIEDLYCCRHFLVTFPRSVTRHNPVSELLTIPLTSWLLLRHALSIVGPYIDRCVPFQIMSYQLNLPQVDSNQVVERSQGWAMETWCTQFRVS